MNLRQFDREFALTNRLRTEGTQNLLQAARLAGVKRVVAQSFGGWTYTRTGGPIKTEEDPLDPEPPTPFRRTLNAIQYLETAVQGAKGIEASRCATAPSMVRPHPSGAGVPFSDTIDAGSSR